MISEHLCNERGIFVADPTGHGCEVALFHRFCLVLFRRRRTNTAIKLSKWQVKGNPGGIDLLTESSKTFPIELDTERPCLAREDGSLLTGAENSWAVQIEYFQSSTPATRVIEIARC